MSGSESGEKKFDIKMLTAIIPPARELKPEIKKVTERRIRVRRRDEVKREYAYVNPKLAKELGVEEYVEVVVAGRKKFRLKAILKDEVPEREVWCNSELLRENGVADNSIATVRAAKS